MDITEYRKLGMKIGANTLIIGTIEPHFPKEIFIGNYVIFGAESRIITHGPIKPFKEYKKVIIDDHAYVGQTCKILLGTTIGRCSVVGAGSVVTKQFSPYKIIAGNPAKIIRPITAKEILRFYIRTYLMNKPRVDEVNWDLLKKEDIAKIFQLPRDILMEDDPAKDLIKESFSDLDIKEIKKIIGV